MLTLIYNTKEPNGAIKNDAIHIEQSILNVYRHLKRTKPTAKVFVSDKQQLSEALIILTTVTQVQDIERLEKVQRKFTHRLPGFKQLSYVERLQRLSLCSLELCRIHFDLC